MFFILSLTACGSAQRSFKFTTAITADQAICRADRVMRVAPWRAETNAKRRHIRLRPVSDSDPHLPTGQTKTLAGDWSVVRTVVIQVDGETPETTVRVSVRNETCPGANFQLPLSTSPYQNLCHYSKPGSDSINRLIGTIGRGLELLLRDGGPECQLAPTHDVPDTGMLRFGEPRFPIPTL